jgi:hypothetical protein
MIIDYIVLLCKIVSAFFVVKTRFERNAMARYNRFAVIFYFSGVLKLLLIDLAFLSDGVLVSIPIYALTVIYIFSTIVFLPILRELMKTIDAAHSRLVLKERQDSARKETKRLIEERVAMMFTKRMTTKVQKDAEVEEELEEEMVKVQKVRLPS